MKAVLTLILIWSGKPVDYSNLRIFGCPAYAPRSQDCIFVGYGSVKGYRLLCVDSKKIVRDVTFNESVFTSHVGAFTTVQEIEVDIPVVDSVASSRAQSVILAIQSVSVSAPPVSNNHIVAQDRHTKNIFLPAHHDVVEPSSYSEAISSNIQKNFIWDFVELHEGERPLKCKWIYKKDDGISAVKPARWKSHLVVRGFEQREV